jgi:hypothetical protein
VDHQIGAVAEIGAGHGLPMTLTKTVVHVIHEIEDGTRERAQANFDVLERQRVSLPGVKTPSEKIGSP